MTTYSDSFTRANNADLGTDWTPQTGAAACRIAANTAQPLATGAVSAEYWATNTVTNDQFAQGTLAVGLETDPSHLLDGMGVAVCMATGDQSKYCLIGSADAARNLQIVSVDAAGVETALGTYTATAVAVGDVLRLEREGTALRGYVNGVLRIAVTNATLVGGRIGLAGATSNFAVALDDWSGGDFVAGSGSRPMFRGV